MADSDKILQGFYKGIPIAITAGSVSGGRKTAVKQFPNRNTQSVEDLGLLPRKYRLEIVINDKPDQDYFAYRNRLLSALESRGTGELIHPLYGRVSDVAAVSYSLNESFTAFGGTVVSVNFEIDDNTGIPQAALTSSSEVASLNNAVQAAVNSDIADNLSVTISFAGNFTAAVDKVTAIIDRANESTSLLGETAEDIDNFSALIGELSADVNSLVTNPQSLATSVNGLFDSVNGLYQSAEATFEAFKGFFDFGSDDAQINQNTVGRQERQANNEILNGAVSASAIGYAYLAATQVDFKTTREIDDLTAELDSQYEAILENGSSQAVKDSVTNMRVTVLDVLDQARVNASQIVTVETLPTTARLLAFSYYGSDELAQDIVDLNDIADVSFIEGELEILTDETAS